LFQGLKLRILVDAALCWRWFQSVPQLFKSMRAKLPPSTVKTSSLAAIAMSLAAVVLSPCDVSAQNVLTCHCDDNSATLCYTLDGTLPTTNFVDWTPLGTNMAPQIYSTSLIPARATSRIASIASLDNKTQAAR
jgi:hypothetical protein